MKWRTFKDEKPPHNTRILVCDSNGYVSIEDTENPQIWRQRGYPVANLFNGKLPNFRSAWQNGNGTRLVAWMPLPDWPENLCNKNANGESP